MQQSDITPQKEDNIKQLIGNSAVSGIAPISTINRASNVSGLTGVSPILNLVSNDFSSYDSNKSYFNDAKLSKGQIIDSQNNNNQNEMAFDDGEMNTTIRSESTQNLPHASSSVQDYFNQKYRRKGYRQKYELRLSIQYKTQIGEYLAVVGNIEELGFWNNFEKCKLKWTEGHFWVTENLIITNKPFFTYKYVIMEQGEPKIWEQGPNRLADLDVLPDNNPQIGRIQSQSSMTSRGFRERSQSPTHKQNKICEINDEWEYFKIKFSINDPIEEQLTNHGDYMRIIGSTPKMGSNNAAEMESTQPIRMNRAQRPVEWLIDKYGQKIRPWEIIISFKNTELLLPNEIIYNYSKSNYNGTSVVKEREPSRSMIIQPPETYNGELGYQNSSQWKNQQQVWIVNGMIDKADANFLGGLYFDKVADSNVFIGTYPLRDDDIQKMKEAGITGIMNLQTDQDIEQRSIPIKKQKEVYKQKQIKFVRFPLNDNDEDDFCANLFTGAQYLNNMINVEGLTVYLHCTSGISRAPALLVVYLCLFKRVKQWKSPYHVSQYIKSFHVNSNPNMRAVQRVVEANLEFQNQQIPVSPERSQASVKQISNDRSVIEEQQNSEGFYFPQMMDEDRKQKNSSNSPNRNTLPPRPNRKSSYVKQFVPIHNTHQITSMSYYNPKQKQTNQSNRSSTPTPITQTKNLQNQQTNDNQNKSITIQKSENESFNEKEQMKVMKYHENSPLSLSKDECKKGLKNNDETESPLQTIEKHEKIINELNEQKKELTNNNLLLEAAMQAATVVPNQVETDQDQLQEIINDKALKDQARDHLLQEMNARSKRAETLRLKRQQIANQRKLKELQLKIKNDKKDIEIDQDELQNEQNYQEVNEIIKIENQIETIVQPIMQTKQIIQRSAFPSTLKQVNNIQILDEQLVKSNINQEEQQKKDEEVRKEAIRKQTYLLCDIYIDELINNKTIILINEVYGQELKLEHQKKLDSERIAREEAEKQLERLRQEKIEREILEKKRIQQLEDEKAQKERLKRISEENELEKARLKQMMDEQEIERMRKQLHDEHLKMLWEAQRRQETLKDIQDAEEQELERRALMRIAREKEEKMRKIKQEQDLLERQKMEQYAIEKALQQEMIKKAEIEAEQLRQQRIKNAQDELEGLQNLRKTEEEKLQRIKESYELEEQRRKQFIEQERQAIKLKLEHEEQIRLIKLQQHQIQLHSQQLIYGGYRPFINQEQIPSPLNQSKTNNNNINVYYESNFIEQNDSQSTIKKRNKSFIENNFVNNHLENNQKSQSDFKNSGNNENGQTIEDVDQKTVTDIYDDKKSFLISSLTIKHQMEDQMKVKASIRDDSIEKKCEEFFGREPPIKFIARKGNRLEDQIQKLIKKNKITIPIIHLRQQMYLFGTQKVNIEQKALQIMVRSGNTLDRFDSFTQKNHKKMEKQLILYMSISQETLSQVIEKLIKGQKIQKASSPEKTITPDNKSPITPKAFEQRIFLSKQKQIDNFVKRVSLKLQPNSPVLNQFRSDSQNNQINCITQMREKSGLSSRGSANSLSKQNQHFLNTNIQESIQKTRLNRFVNSTQREEMQNCSSERIGSPNVLGVTSRFQIDHASNINEGTYKVDIKVANRINSPDKFNQMMESPQRIDSNWSPSRFGASFDQKQIQHEIKMKEAKDFYSKYQKQKITQRQSLLSNRGNYPKIAPVRKLQVIQKDGTYLAQIQTSGSPTYRLQKYSQR